MIDYGIFIHKGFDLRFFINLNIQFQKVIQIRTIVSPQN
jgi:hypothetical protein